MTSEVLNIFQRINKVMQEVDYIQKEKKAGMRYSIVSHDAVTAKVRPLMVKHGIVYYPVDFEVQQVGNRTQVVGKVIFASIDNPQDRFAVSTIGYGIDEQDKGPGKAISYAVKYALLKCLGLETGDDPDEDQETPHQSAEILSIRNFEEAIATAGTEDELRQVANDYRADMEAAIKQYPAKVQAAKAAWQKRMVLMKKKTAEA